MSLMGTATKIKSVVLRTESILWKELSFLQTDELKDLAPEDMNRLKQSLLQNNFADPFKVWDNTKKEMGRLYSLDGRHRVRALLELEQEGHKVPRMLPATFIDCPNKKVAAALVLVYSSIYARTNQEGLYGYLEDHGLDLDSIKQYLSLPDIDMEQLCIPDFSGANLEVNVEAFPNEMEMKFLFTKEDFVMINIKLEQIRKDLQLESKEEALKHLVSSYA